jgi:hypothetical protein
MSDLAADNSTVDFAEGEMIGASPNVAPFHGEGATTPIISPTNIVRFRSKHPVSSFNSPVERGFSLVQILSRQGSWGYAAGLVHEWCTPLLPYRSTNESLNIFRFSAVSCPQIISS